MPWTMDREGKHTQYSSIAYQQCIRSPRYSAQKSAYTLLYIDMYMSYSD